MRFWKNLFDYNDYELLYLNSLESEEARDILFKKYLYLIRKKITDFGIYNSFERADYEQEGIIILNKAIAIYKEESNMTFTKFFEMLLEHRFIDLKRKRKNEKIYFISNEMIDYATSINNEYNLLYEDVNISYGLLSRLEKTIYSAAFEQNLSNKQICEKYNLKLKQIYAAKARIRAKNIK